MDSQGYYTAFPVVFLKKRGMMRLSTLLILLLVFLTGCAAVQESSQLSEIQTEACAAADDAGTCTTRLLEVGIVMPEDCCQALGRCCS